MPAFLRFRGLRRRSLLAVLALALMLSLLPTAAFAYGGPHMSPGYAPHPPQYYRQAPRYNYSPRQNYAPRQTYAPRQYNWPQQEYRYSGCDATYRVRRGDTLSEIARHYRVSVRELANANRLGSPNRIYAGTTLCIPR